MTQVLDTEMYKQARSKQAVQLLREHVPGAVLAEVVLMLGYFWAVQISYGLRVTGSSVTLFAAVEYGYIHWHGPSVYILSGIGLLAPLLCFLPLIPVWLLRRKFSVWVSLLLWLVWIGEVMALGFITPRVAF